MTFINTKKEALLCIQAKITKLEKTVHHGRLEGFFSEILFHFWTPFEIAKGLSG